MTTIHYNLKSFSKILLISCLLLFSSVIRIQGFTSSWSQLSKISNNVKRTIPNTFFYPPAFSVFETQATSTTTSIYMKKKSQQPQQNTNPKSKPSSNNSSPTKKKLSAFDIFLAFATPWRNPNSILLYMFIIVYILGKMNENSTM